jgi:hypothetical protein
MDQRPRWFPQQSGNRKLPPPPSPSAHTEPPAPKSTKNLKKEKPHLNQIDTSSNKQGGIEQFFAKAGY